MTAKQNKKVKHIPQRTCIVCRETNEKKKLVRFVRSTDGILPESSGKIPGRGAYIHDCLECAEKALNLKILARALKTDLTEQDIERIKRWINTQTEAG